MSFGGSFFGAPQTVLRDLEVDGTTIVVDETNDRVGIGDAAPGTTLQLKGTAPYVTLQNSTAENTSGGCEAKIIFEDHANASLGQIEVSHSGTSDDTKGKMVLSTHTGSTLTAAVTIDDAQKVTAAGDAVLTGNVSTDGSISLKEKAAAIGDTAAYGQLWVKTAAPNELYFTTDNGNDIQITSGTGMAFVGDITAVTAGVGLSGGGTTGALTLTLDLSELSAVTPTATDSFATLDSDGAVEQRTTITALSALQAGTGLTASSGVIGVDAAQTQITSVGTIGTGTWQGTAVAMGYGGTGLVGATDGKIVIADGAGAPVLLDVGSSTAITVLGTVATGTWQGTAVASAYLDADTAHLSGAQTFTGTKTLNSFKGTGATTVTNILDEDAMGTNSATALATQQSIKAYADTKSVLAGSSSITTVGTVGTGTWQGTAVASAYLDSDTAHLSGAQTFTGTKTLNSFKGTGGATVTNILDEDAMGSDSATALATQQSIKAYVTANAGTSPNDLDLNLHMQVFS